MKTKKIKVVESQTNRKIKYEIVDGYLVGDHLGVYFRVGKGWRVIHIPTAYLVTKANFLNLKDAQHFADITQKTFGALLAAPSISVIKDNLHVPGGKVFEQLRLRLESPERLVEVEEINEHLTRIVRDGQGKRMRQRGESLVATSVS